MGGAAVVVAVSALLLWRVSKSTRWQVCGELVWEVPTPERFVALTFDDGPDPGHVDEMLAVLRERNARGTFFLTGLGIETDPVDAARIVGAGHEIGNHSYSHRRMILRSDAFISTEIEATDRLIRALGVDGEILFRPPYGKKLLGLPRYLAEHDRKTIMWTVDAEDDPSRGQDPMSIAEHVVSNVYPGAIVLFHILAPSRASERRALPIVLDRLTARGYRFVALSSLLAQGFAGSRKGTRGSPSKNRP